METLDIPLTPPIPECYKMDHSFVSLSSAAKSLNCSVEGLQEQMRNGERERFAQTILVDTDKYPDGREYLRKPVFRVTELQLECVLENKGYTIDLDPELNGWMMGPCPPRQVRVEIRDLRVLLPNSELGDSDNCCNHYETLAQTNVDKYLEQNKDTPPKEKVRWLRETARKNNEEIGALLNIGTFNPDSKSRKNQVQTLYKSNFDKETWKKMHPAKKKGK